MEKSAVLFRRPRGSEVGDRDVSLFPGVVQIGTNRDGFVSGNTAAGEMRDQAEKTSEATF